MTRKGDGDSGNAPLRFGTGRPVVSGGESGRKTSEIRPNVFFGFYKLQRPETGSGRAPFTHWQVKA